MISSRSWDHLKTQVNSIVKAAVDRDRERIVEVIDRNIDKLNEKARKVDLSGGDSGIYHHAVTKLNDVRAKVLG